MTTKYYVVEHKTSSLDISPGMPYWRRLRIDAQNSNYLYGARSLGIEPDGVLYDVVRKPSIRPYEATPEEARKYKKDGELYANQREHGESEDDFRARVRYEIQQDPSKWYQRQIVVRMAREEEEAQRDEWYTARNLRESELANRWPRNPGACDQYGSLCQYFDVCTGVASINDNAIFRDSGEHEELESVPDTRSLPVVTTSSLGTFRSCPRRYQYGYFLKRRAVESKKALRFGTLFHRGLEFMWRANKEGSPGLTRASLDEGLAAMTGNDDRELDAFDLIKAQELLIGYWAMWSAESLTTIGVEVEFRAPLVNPETGRTSTTYERSGKIDALVRYEE